MAPRAKQGRLREELAQSPDHKPTSLHFPQEIVDEFLAYMMAGFFKYWTRNDSKDFRACNQVSRSFHLAAQRQMFAEVHLMIEPDEPESKRSTQLRDLLETYPDTAQAVQSLVLASAYPKGGVSPCPPDTKFIDIHLPVILKLLPGMRKFSMNDLSRGCLSWSNYSDDIRIAIFDLQGHPSINSLDITDNTDFPIDLLQRWTGLEHVSISRAPFGMNEARDQNTSLIPESSKDRSPPQLDSFVMHNIFFADFLQTLRLIGNPRYSIISKLKTFRGSAYNSEACQGILQVLERVPGSLETLNLILQHGSSDSDFWAPAARGLEPLSFRALREVRIEDGSLNIFRHEQDPSVISNVLCSFASSPCIESIHAQFSWCFREPVDRIEGRRGSRSYEEECMHPHLWARLDTLLAAAPHFRHLDLRLNFTAYTNRGKIFGPKRKYRFKNNLKNWTAKKVFKELSKTRKASISISAGIL